MDTAWGAVRDAAFRQRPRRPAARRAARRPPRSRYAASRLGRLDGAATEFGARVVISWSDSPKARPANNYGPDPELLTPNCQRRLLAAVNSRGVSAGVALAR